MWFQRLWGRDRPPSDPQELLRPRGQLPSCTWAQSGPSDRDGLSQNGYGLTLSTHIGCLALLLSLSLHTCQWHVRTPLIPWGRGFTSELTAHVNSESISKALNPRACSLHCHLHPSTTFDYMLLGRVSSQTRPGPLPASTRRQSWGSSYLKLRAVEGPLLP